MPDAPSTAKPAGRRARNRRDRERSYLDAAFGITERDGIRGLTMQRLADEVDAAVGTVYTYFPSKSALVAELQRTSIERLLASYHITRDRSDDILRSWGDPVAESVARLAVFGRFWVASVDTFPQEASFLHTLMTVTEQVPVEEHHRVLPAAMALLDEARTCVTEAGERGAIVVDDAMALVIRWAAALTGCLLTMNLSPLNPVAFDGRRLARLVQHDLLAGWGAPADALRRAEDHVAFLEQVAPLAPPLPADVDAEA
jgi:AcrR family transcriptional regulator